MRKSEERDVEFGYRRQSFLLGFISILDWGGTLDNYDEFFDSDYLALESDWDAVGDDIRAAMAEVKREKL